MIHKGTQPIQEKDNSMKSSTIPAQVRSAVADFALILGFNPGVPSSYQVPDLGDGRRGAIGPQFELAFECHDEGRDFERMNLSGNAEFLSIAAGAHFERLYVRIERLVPRSNLALAIDEKIVGMGGVRVKTDSILTTFDLGAGEIEQLRAIGAKEQSRRFVRS